MRVISLVWVLSVFPLALTVSPVVHTKYGPVKGFTTETPEGKQANIFLGIPFAKPPVGDLRFEKPEKPQKWTKTVDTVKFSAACPPHHRSAIATPNINEDCLYLNVMAPSQKPDKGYAVLVWIHGGGFNTGNAEQFGFQNITNNFVSRDIVFVTIQYRLGPLGFFSSGDSVLPGNLGLWDQEAALEFVKEDIKHFGGDPERITIIGVSAGGASTSALTLSPHTRSATAGRHLSDQFIQTCFSSSAKKPLGLFTGSIQMSGSAFAEWSSTDLAVNSSLVLAKELKCEVENSRSLKRCLKTKTIDELFDAVDKTGRTRKGVKLLKYSARFDGDFFPRDFETLASKRPKVPTIIGVAEKEAIMFTLYRFLEPISNIFVPAEDFEKYGEADLVDFVKNEVASKADFGNEAEKVQKRILDYYSGTNKTAGKDYKYWLETYTQINSDIIFNIPCLREAEIKVENDWPVWLYMTEYFDPDFYPEDFPVKGATHGFETVYMFGTYLPRLRKKELSEQELKLQKAILDSFTNFAKKSNPSTDDFEWPKATKEQPFRNLRLRPEPVVETTMYEDSYNFWKTLGHYKYDIISGKMRSTLGEDMNEKLCTGAPEGKHL